MDRGYTFAGLCKGTTKKGTPCQRSVVYANGFCQAHGGDSSEFMKERAKYLAAKMLRRHEKWRRKFGFPPREKDTNAT